MDPEGIKEELQHLKALHVDGIVVDCWWGIVEAWAPKKYEWPGYREMFNIIREFGMKLQVIWILSYTFILSLLCASVTN